MRQSCLHERHEELGATFAEFGGWLMPLEYAGVVSEHDAIRDGVGAFDVSHLGTLRVTGTGAAAALDGILTNGLHRLSPGQAQYTMLCDEDGGVVDDLIAYLEGPDDVLLVPNAANAALVAERVASLAPGLEVADLHDDVAVIAVQGPTSDDLLRGLRLPVDFDYMAFVHADLAGVDVTICRTGYTGERGVELLVPRDAAGELWDSLMAAGAVPCGLGARDTLRLEMGYALHGQDLSETISPVMAGLTWAVDWHKGDFPGREALVAQRSANVPRLRALRMIDRGIPRAHMSVLGDEGQHIGEVTSGTFSPTLKQGVALALLDPAVTVGDEVSLDVRGRLLRAEVAVAPFVPSRVRD